MGKTGQVQFSCSYEQTHLLISLTLTQFIAHKVMLNVDQEKEGDVTEQSVPALIANVSKHTNTHLVWRIAQQLRPLAVLAEDPGLFPSVHVLAHKYL